MEHHPLHISELGCTKVNHILHIGLVLLCFCQSFFSNWSRLLLQNSMLREFLFYVLLYIEIILLGMLLYQALLSQIWKIIHIFFIWQNKMSHILRFPLLRLLAWSANPGHNQEATRLNHQYKQAFHINFAICLIF